MNEESLYKLRLEVARCARVMGVESMQLPVLAMTYEELCKLAKNQDKGWNSLLMKMLMKYIKLEESVTKQS